jgi:TldD protein
VEDVLRAALAAALTGGVRAAEVRIVAPHRYEHLAIRDGRANALTSTTSVGLGVRVRTDRAWGFAASSAIDLASARATARLAARVARAAARTARGPLELAPVDGPANGRYRSEVRRDPFEVPLEEKVRLLVDAERELHVAPEIKSGEASFQAWSDDKWFASSEGVGYHAAITHVGAGVAATAVLGKEVQRRTAPTSFGGDYRQAGWEFIHELDLAGSAPRVGREATALLTAPSIPEETTTVVLASDQLALQVHESVGHATELDRILGFEAGYAGTSFLTTAGRGALRYGSPLMNIVADATEPGGLGTFGWDDEGVAAKRTPLVEHGVLTGFLTSRETAARTGLATPGGTARAGGAERMPLIRMTNVDLEPGDHTVDELLADIDHGIYFETNRSWSIDDKRLNFQFGTEVGRVIQHGELGPLVRNPIYSGMTPEFWGSMDAVGNASTWHLWGIPNCGKGQPSQAARVGHGAPVARFRNVRVRGG